MEIRAEEISEIIRKQIKEYGTEVEVAETLPCFLIPSVGFAVGFGLSMFWNRFFSEDN